MPFDFMIGTAVGPVTKRINAPATSGATAFVLTAFWKAWIAASVGLESNQVFEAVEQRIDISVLVVRRQAGTGYARDTERTDKRLGTMMATAQCHTAGVEMVADFFGGEIFNRE